MNQSASTNSRTDLTQSLREEAFLTLLWSLLILALLLVFIGLVIVSISIQTLPLALPIAGLFFVTFWSANSIRKRNNYNLAVSIALCGMLLSIVITLVRYPVGSNNFIFFTPLTVIAASMLLRPSFGFVFAAIGVVLIGATTTVFHQSSSLWSYPFVIAILLAFLSALLGYLMAQTFLTAVEWAVDSYHKVERREKQLFESEQQLQRTLLEKNFLNGQLLNSNQELDRARAAAEDANRLKTQFVTNMSHELRTPLNSIIGFSYILGQQLKGPMNQNQLDYLQRIYDSGEHLMKLLNDILDNAKLEAGRIDLSCEPVLLDTVIHEIMMTATSLLRERPIELRQAIQPDLPPVYGDRLRIAQVLLNLLSNAIKFTDEGAITLRAFTVPASGLYAVLHINNGEAHAPLNALWYVIVEVIDTGIGIAEEHQQLIFEEYEQADVTLARRYSGTGLGLPISRRLVELHEGKLTVCSTLGAGSTFRFSLPVASTEQIRAVAIAQEM